MKKLLIVAAAVIVVIALVLWVVSWFRVPEAVAASGAREWPGGMGTLESVAGRFPPRQANDAAVKWTALAKPLPQSQPIEDFVRGEIARAELTIGEPPALPDVSAIREVLLREPIVWERRNEGVGDPRTSEMRAVQMIAARALVASALAKARANDPTAWDDLRAVWNLARSLDGEPQVMSRTASLTMDRMINAVAWKMPLPAPAWISELQEHDHVRSLIEAFQVQTAEYWKDGGQIFPTKLHADWVDHDRQIAVELFSVTRCDVNTRPNKHGADLTSVWHRAFRYRAEREATANALRVREGKAIEPGSRCSGGAWAFDGKTLRFNTAIAPASPRDVTMPLVLNVAPVNA